MVTETAAKQHSKASTSRYYCPDPIQVWWCCDIIRNAAEAYDKVVNNSKNSQQGILPAIFDIMEI